MFIIDLIYFILKIILFILIIYGFQYGWNTIADTYTKPKTKDLVNSQLKKYKDLLGEIQTPNGETDIRKPEILFVSDEDKKQMNDDLLSFMNDQTQILYNVDK